MVACLICKGDEYWVVRRNSDFGAYYFCYSCESAFDSEVALYGI